MTYRWSTILVLCIVPLFAMAQQDGSSCERAIPVDADYKGTVPAAGTYWFTATTYDLPLNVHFSPNSDNCTVYPTVEVDFTCTPEQYDDAKLAEVISSAAEWNVTMPMKFTCDLVINHGKREYDLSIDKNYREQLASCGITYSVRAFVKVNFPEGGTITLKPDTAFQDCIDHAHYMGGIGLPDTIWVFPHDSGRVFVVPYAEWQNDSMRFVWSSKSPVRIYLATTQCSFVPESSYPFVWDYYDIEADSLIKIYSEQMKEAIKNNTGGGLFYAKILADSPGRLIVEKIPRSLPRNHATLLHYGQTVSLAANDTNRLFAFPREWTATQFAAATRHLFTTYISAEPVFHLSAGDTRVLRVNQGYLEEGRRMAYLSDVEMKALFSKTQDDYLYVRFACNEATALTPTPWLASDCALKSTLITPNVAFSVQGSASSQVYRMLYSDIEGYRLTLQWEGNGRNRVYIGDTCNFALSKNNIHVLQYKNISPHSSVTIPDTEVNGWSNKMIDPDGYIYIHFNAAGGGRMIFLSTKPAEVELPYTTATIHLLCQDDKVLVSVSEEQDLTLIDAAGQTISTWHQQANTSSVLPVHKGEKYILKGKSEQIIIEN